MAVPQHFEPVVLLSERTVTPTIAVEVLPFGLTINRILINGDGKTHDIVIGPYDIQDHETTRKFQNPIVGRYCNRVPAGEHHISKGGAQGVVTAISNESPTVSLHGGPGGFDRSVFSPFPSLSAAKLFTPAELSTIANPEAATIFTFTSPAGDQGYPGQLDVEVLVAVLDPPVEATPTPPQTQSVEHALGSILLVYRAIVRNDPTAEGDGTKIITPVNLTQHWGFNLDASHAKAGGETPDVKAQKLRIDSAHTLVGDSVLLPTGELNEVAGGPWDFRGQDVKIGDKYPNPGYDHFHLFPRVASRQPTHVPLKELTSGSQNLLAPIVAESELGIDKASAAPVTLSSERSGIRLAFNTNQRGVQFYSGIGLDGSGTRKKIHGGSESGTGYLAGTAAFLEFHAPHSAFLKTFAQEGETRPDDDTILASMSCIING